MTSPATQVPADAPAARMRWTDARLLSVAGPGVVLASMIIMIGWTWDRCPDPVVDFGRELYVPWRITEGQVLYRDLNHYNGPLSPYLNAMLFEIFGVSVRTLKLGNAVILLGLALLLYRMMREMGGRTAATAGGVVFATVFACAQLTQLASFNWLTPYSHDLTHGIALSLAMVACIWRYQATCRTRWLALAGLLLGLVSLTKAEVLLAALVAVGGGLGAIGVMSRPSGRDATRAAAWFIVPAILPAILATLLLWLAMPLGEALSGVAGAWRWLGDARLLGLSYFRWLMGIDDPVRNFVNMFVWTGWYATILLPGLMMAAALRRGSRAAVLSAALIIAALVALVLGWNAMTLPWAQIARPLPVMLVVIVASLGLRLPLVRSGAPSSRLVLTITFTLFALALLLRMFLRVNVYHYGFALAMPAMMIAILALVDWAPRWAARGAPAQWVGRAAMLSAAGVMVGMMLYTSHLWMAQRIHNVGEGADRYLAGHRGEIVERARREIVRLSAPGETLVCIPEAQMLSYLTRRVNPTRHQNFMPAEMIMFQESRMLEELRAQPPQWIVLVHVDTSIYGVPFFGRDYGRSIAWWIRSNYDQVSLIGALPFTSNAFGIRIMRRISSTTHVAPTPQTQQ